MTTVGTVTTGAILAVLTVLACLLRWDRSRRRPCWVWTADRRQSKTMRRSRWVARIALIVIATGIVAGPVVLAPPALAANCPDAPAPDRPGRGMTGTIDSGSAQPGTQGSAGTVYGDYGYAGLSWKTFDLGCTIGEPLNNAMTETGNFVFNVAKNVVAVANGLHYRLTSPGAFDWLDGLMSALSAGLFTGVMAQWAPLVLLLVAVVLLWLAKSGDNAGAAKRATWALVGFWMAASAALLPTTYNVFFRDQIVTLSQTAQNGFLDPNASNNAVADALSEKVIVPAWQAGEFVDPTSPLGKKWTKELLAYQACTKAETANGSCDGLSEAKQDSYRRLAVSISKNDRAEASEDKDSAGYSLFVGRDGMARISSGFVALFESGWIALFQIVAGLVLFMSLLTIAIMILLLPITGLLGMLNQNVLRNIIRIFGNAFFTAILTSVLAGLHVRIAILTIESGLPFLVQGIILIFVTWMFLAIARPIQRTKAMLSAAVDLTGASSNTLKMPKYRHPRNPTQPKSVPAQVAPAVAAAAGPAGFVAGAAAATAAKAASAPARPRQGVPEEHAVPAAGPWTTGTQTGARGGGAALPAARTRAALPEAEATRMAASLLRQPIPPTSVRPGNTRPGLSGGGDSAAAVVGGGRHLSALGSAVPSEALPAAPSPGAPSLAAPATRPGLPAGGVEARPPSTRTTPSGPTVPPGPISTLGLTDTGEFYDPAAAERAAGRVLDAHQDQAGVWHVSPQSELQGV